MPFGTTILRKKFKHWTLDSRNTATLGIVLITNIFSVRTSAGATKVFLASLKKRVAVAVFIPHTRLGISVPSQLLIIQSSDMVYSYMSHKTKGFSIYIATEDDRLSARSHATTANGPAYHLDLVRMSSQNRSSSRTYLIKIFYDCFQ